VLMISADAPSLVESSASRSAMSAYRGRAATSACPDASTRATSAERVT
jgi:hypothetical protein